MNHKHPCDKCKKPANFIGVSERSQWKYHCPECYTITYVKAENEYSHRENCLSQDSDHISLLWL